MLSIQESVQFASLDIYEIYFYIETTLAQLSNQNSLNSLHLLK